MFLVDSRRYLSAHFSSPLKSLSVATLPSIYQLITHNLGKEGKYCHGYHKLSMGTIYL